jgi:hypothetical protein
MNADELPHVLDTLAALGDHETAPSNYLRKLA